MPKEKKEKRDQGTKRNRASKHTSKPRKQARSFMHKHDTHKIKRTHSKRFKELIQPRLKVQLFVEARQCKEKTTATDKRKRTKENKDNRERDREKKNLEMNRRTDGQTDRYRDRQIEGQTDTETDTHR